MLPRRTRLSRSHLTGLIRFSPAICRLFGASQNVISHRISSFPPLSRKTSGCGVSLVSGGYRGRGLFALLLRSRLATRYSPLDLSSLESVFTQNFARKSFGIRSYAKMPGCGILPQFGGCRGVGPIRIFLSASHSFTPDSGRSALHSCAQLSTAHCPLPTVHSLSFLFINLQIPPFRLSICMFFPFISLQIPFFTTTLFSNRYKTPGVPPPHVRAGRSWPAVSAWSRGGRRGRRRREQDAATGQGRYNRVASSGVPYEL
jgi:hypothetical protein